MKNVGRTILFSLFTVISAIASADAWYGTNYTTPFAHAYRALGYLGLDRKEAIRKDAYHLARLGLNAFRLHLWDTELADSAGNLIKNDHLDLLDYTIAEMEGRGMDVILTAQTNFGNGYPERNIDTGAFTYDYAKCDIHENKQAQKAQARYLDALVRHINPYTGLSYAADPRIVAIEINNEPCHSGTKKEVTAYINKMAKVIRRAGFNKPVLYNVSHNDDVREAYYDADIDGTTYQWYPVGLVSGRQRKGNMLPAVDEYSIPWEKTMKNYERLSKIIYEFDPGDELDSYLYPAIVRTLRGKGFEWITQFAYDPIDLAPYNTEYQTHYLNLAYTPKKAIGMMIAAEAMKRIPAGSDSGKLPTDTVFGPFRLSYKADLAEMNTPETFIYTNTTTSQPVCIDSLLKVAGTGNSALVGYEGNGAYFLDRLGNDIWRLEVMPDVVLTDDPFKKPSLTRRVGHIIKSERPIRITLPSLGNDYHYLGVNKGNESSGHSTGDTITVYPGVYLLGKNPEILKSVDTDSAMGHIKVGEYVAPSEAYGRPLVVHTPPVLPQPGEKLTLRARVFNATPVDSVMVYPGDVSFWRDDNTTYRMAEVADGVYETEITVPGKAGEMTYNIVVFSGDNAETFPSSTVGTPLSWDYPQDADSYIVEIRDASAPVRLIDGARDADVAEMYLIPSGGASWSMNKTDRFPTRRDELSLNFNTAADSTKVIIRKFIGERLPSSSVLSRKNILKGRINLPADANDIEIGFVTRDGYTYTSALGTDVNHIEIPLSELQQTYTDIVPEPYPSFMNRKFTPEVKIPFSTDAIEFVTLRFSHPAGKGNGTIESLWLE